MTAENTAPENLVIGGSAASGSARAMAAAARYPAKIARARWSAAEALMDGGETTCALSWTVTRDDPH
jgi:hypothetical protein